MGWLSPPGISKASQKRQGVTALSDTENDQNINQKTTEALKRIMLSVTSIALASFPHGQPTREGICTHADWAAWGGVRPLQMSEFKPVADSVRQSSSPITLNPSKFRVIPELTLCCFKTWWCQSMYTSCQQYTHKYARTWNNPEPYGGECCYAS